MCHSAVRSFSAMSEHHPVEGHGVGSMSSPLADEEELLRLVTQGKSQSEIAELKGTSREAVRQRLVALRPVMEQRGIVVHDGRGRRHNRWVPWTLGSSTTWRLHYTMKMLRLLGRRYDGPPLSEDEERRLQAFLDKLDNYGPLDGGRAVVTFRGPEVGVRLVPRRPEDRGYVRWPEGVPDTRPKPPELILPDEHFDDPHEERIWQLTDLTLSERYERILEMRQERSTKRSVAHSGNAERNAS